MITTEEKQFVQENLEKDTSKLLLNPPPSFKDNIEFLVDQIRSRQKAKDKLPTWHDNLELVLPPPLSVEQSSSELLANYKAGLVNGQLLIDLSGGMGIDCLGMSKSFKETVYVEANPQLCNCFKYNSNVLGQLIEVVNQKAESFLTSANFTTKPVVFIDPDRRSEAKKQVRFSDCSPDVSTLIKSLKDVAIQVLIKASPMLDIKSGIKDLEAVKEVHVLSAKNECKEVLFFLDFMTETIEPTIKTVNTSNKDKDQFDFKYSDEDSATSTFADPQNYLLLPNASILKAGAFKTFGERFGISKVATNTHVYTSNIPIPNFPGRQFEILSAKLTLKEMAKYLPLRRVNVITRNYPTKPEAIIKKHKLKEGGELYLIGFRDSKGKSWLPLCKKL